MTQYKNKLIEYENKFKDLNGKKEVEDKKFQEMKTIIDDLNKKMDEKNKKYEKLAKENSENEEKFKGMEKFMNTYFKKDLINLYKQQCGN